MKHIKITEKNLGSEEILFDEDFSKLAMVTDVSVGMVGFSNLEDISGIVDIIVTMYFTKQMKDDADRKDVFYMKLIFMIHMLMTIVGDLLDEDVSEEFKSASENLTKALADIAKAASEDCSYMNVIDLESFDEYVGKMLMDELEEYERRQSEK